jgi:integration host factor subunit alpha
VACTKTTIIEKISEKNNQTPSQAKETLEVLIEIMKETLASGEDIMISGFGKFQVNEKAPRKGRNPATGETKMLKKSESLCLSVLVCCGIVLMDENKKNPFTIAEAVNKLLSDLTIEDKNRIKNSSEEDLTNFHFGLGMTIRNDFGLWGKDSKLLENCKELSGDLDIHVDTASEIIIKALWERLQKFPPPKLVRDDNQYSSY